MYQQTEEKIWVPFNSEQGCRPSDFQIKRDLDELDESENNRYAEVAIIDGLANSEGNLAGIIYDFRRCNNLIVFYNENGMPVSDQPSIKGHEEEYQLMMQVPCYKGYTVIAPGSSFRGKTTTIELTVPFETREDAEEWINRSGDPFVHVVAEVKWPAIR
jgi:hypothetical protein